MRCIEVKKRWSLLLMSGLLCLAGCQGKTQQNEMEMVTSIQEPVEIEFWHGMSGALGETMTELVADFNEEIGSEKGITVKSTYQGNYEDLKAKTMAAIKAGNNPAVIQGTVNNIMEFIGSGIVQPLDDYIFNQEIGMNDFKDIYEGYRLENSSYCEDQRYYALPFSKSTDLLFYNRTFFDEHGLTVPTTWDELTEVSKKIYELTGKTAFSIDNPANYLITYLMQAGAEYTNSKGDLLFNNEAAIEALTMLQDNVNAGYWRLAGEDSFSSGPFLAENVYLYIGSSASEAFLPEENFVWEAAMIPQLKVDQPQNIQQGNNVAILNKNKTSEEVYAAFEFIKYLASDEANLKWATSTGYLPIRESVATSEDYASYVQQAKQSAKEAGIEAAKSGFVEPLFLMDHKNSNLVRTEVGAMIEEIVLTNADVVETIERYIQKLN